MSMSDAQERQNTQNAENIEGPQNTHVTPLPAMEEGRLAELEARNTELETQLAQAKQEASDNWNRFVRERADVVFFFNATAPTEIYTLSLHDALPITDAMLDSVPTVFVAGQVRTELIGTDGFQECDTGGITMPIVKHSFMVQDPREIPQAVHEAFYLARSGRPGPVLVDIPQDLSRADIEYEPASGVSLPGY